ncbi:MAG: TonB family protein [Blastocatellia bacterium]
MKTCPKCQQQYPNGFQYCPNDTELLMTTEEYVRRTMPLAAEPVSNSVESSEVVPISTPPSTPVAPIAKPVTNQRVTETLNQEKAAPTPFRKTEPISASQPQTPKESYKQELKQAAAAAKPTPQQPKAASAASSETIATASAGGFSLSMPQQPGLIENLIASLKNIGQILSKGDYKPGVDTSFLLPEESFSSRISREVGTAAVEFKQNPKQFVTDLARGEGSNLQRRNSLLAGSMMALIGYTTIFFLVLLLLAVTTKNPFWVNAALIGGSLYLAACFATGIFLLRKLIKQATPVLLGLFLLVVVGTWGPVSGLFAVVGAAGNYNLYCLFFPKKCVPPEEAPEEILEEIAMVDTNLLDLKLKESAKTKKEMLGGSKAQPKPAAGGGGGGRNEPTPPSQGRPPQMALTPQIIMPNPEPPKIKNPTLVVASTIYGDPKVMPPMKGPIGDPEGIPAPPSSGPGQGAGIGRGAGTGVGRGGGGGLGPGQGGNTGGGDMALGGGRSVEPMSASLRPTIIYRERAKYTEEARANKIQGTVTLSVVYTFDGRITDIRVVRGLPDGLSESAIEAAKKIRFQPAVKNGQPVSVRGNIEFGFTLY